MTFTLSPEPSQYLLRFPTSCHSHSLASQSRILLGQSWGLTRSSKPRFPQSQYMRLLVSPVVYLGLRDDSIYLDLMAAGLIPDPFIGTNEKDVQWVHLKDWVYRSTFTA